MQTFSPDRARDRLGVEGDLDRLALYRILDANLDRAREGLRIIEEWCRFGLNDSALTEQLKQLRQLLAAWHTPEIRLARDTPGDAGTHLTHPQEAERTSLTQVLQVNFSRTQEALRVLEEYGKLHDRQMAAACKQMRYRVYGLDSQLLGHQRRQQLARSRLYLVTSPSEQLLPTVEAALQGGTSLVQYREKAADDCERLAVAQQMSALCHRYGALFIVNDRVDLALAANADGVHLGQQDLPVAAARQLLGFDRLIGRSTTNPEELQRALAEGADYIGVGPVYETPTKPGKSAAGAEYLRYAREHATVPWFAIGGINADNLAAVLEAGAERVAVVRALMQTDQPVSVAQSLIRQLSQAQTIRPHEQ